MGKLEVLFKALHLCREVGICGIRAAEAGCGWGAAA